MPRVSLTTLAIGLLLALSGCDGERLGQEGKPAVHQAQVKVEKDAALTGEMANRALLEMDERQIPAGVLVPRPKDDPIKVINVDEISIGRYHCNLKERTFHASAFYPKALRHKFNEVHGRFERTADGKWVAKVTESSSGH
jgi:hypothetical protein